MSKKSATNKQLQQLIGKLNWAARVIRRGRTFLRRLIDVICNLKHATHHTRLNATAHADIKWWPDFIRTFNGSTYFVDANTLPWECFSTDACLDGGAGYYMND